MGEARSCLSYESLGHLQPFLQQRPEGWRPESGAEGCSRLGKGLYSSSPEWTVAGCSMYRKEREQAGQFAGTQCPRGQGFQAGLEGVKAVTR